MLLRVLKKSLTSAMAESMEKLSDSLIGPWLSLFFHEMWFNNCITIVTIVSYADGNYIGTFNYRNDLLVYSRFKELVPVFPVDNFSFV